MGLLPLSSAMLTDVEGLSWEIGREVCRLSIAKVRDPISENVWCARERQNGARPHLC